MKYFFRFVYPIVLTVVACWLTLDLHGRPTRGLDDSQILFSYSSNLAAGRGLTYANNPERVEGATSLLWTLISAVPFRLGFDEFGVLAISILLLCATQLLTVDLIRKSAAVRQVPSWPFELVYWLAIISCPAYFTWMSITLMDTCLWGFLVVLMVYVALLPPRSGTGRVLAAIPFFLAPLSRPEAAFVVPAFIVLAWLRGRTSEPVISTSDARTSALDVRPFADRRRLVHGPALAFLSAIAGVTVFRVAYFGYPLPNTYYAKVSPQLSYNLATGGSYLIGFAMDSGPIVVAAILFLVWCASDLVSRALRPRGNSGASPLGSGIAAWRLVALGAIILLLTPVFTGGDHFVGYRFYQPAYPVMVLAVLLFLAARLPSGVLAKVAPHRPPRPGFVLLVLIFGLGYWAYSGAYKPSWLDADISVHKVIKDQFTAAEDGIQEGSRLRALFSEAPDYPEVGVTAAGGIARTYPGRIVDLMGLNTPAIAHRPGARRGFKNHAAFEKDVFFEFKDIVLLLASPPIPPATSNGVSRALKGLLDDPRFFTKWRYGRLYLSGNEEGGFQAFYSAALVDGLMETGPYRFRETMRWSGKRWVLATGTDSTHASCGTESGSTRGE